MPENYIQPVTDRQQCFTCHKTVTGKKKLSKCSKCHAITYCGRACQLDDFARHKWNCIPVMVTKYEGKGRGVMAARDIKMGEVVFVDKPVLKVPRRPNDIWNMLQSLKSQINNMPSEAKIHYDKIPSKEKDICTRALEIIGDHSKSIGEWSILFLNAALINHSCSPNVTGDSFQKNGDAWYEVRAIKDISKGDEISKFYARCGCKEMDEVFSYKAFGCNTQKRRAVIKKHFRFDCKCGVCTGTVPDQEDIIKELLQLHEQFDLRILREREDHFLAGQVKTADKIADLSHKLYIGPIDDKIFSLKLLGKTALKAEDPGTLKKALDGLKKIAADTGIRCLEKFWED